MEKFMELSALMQALIATLFTWLVTALGASSVFLFRKMNLKVLDFLLGFASGVMIAASFWSLLTPALELSEQLGKIIWLIPSIGFIGGGIFVILSDIFLEKLIKDKTSSSRKRSMLLIGAITLHNIPEGLAIGVAFASASLMGGESNLIGAILLAFGIGLQNFPEGAGVSLPLKREGYSNMKSFGYGQASGMVEPIAGILGVLLVNFIRSILPFLLSFAAGCMICVVARELLPEANKENKNYASFGVLFGFALMMILDVSLG